MAQPEAEVGETLSRLGCKAGREMIQQFLVCYWVRRLSRQRLWASEVGIFLTQVRAISVQRPKGLSPGGGSIYWQDVANVHFDRGVFSPGVDVKAFDSMAEQLNNRVAAIKECGKSPGQAGASLAGELERLVNLMRAGALSDEEFQTAKRKLLGL